MQNNKMTKVTNLSTDSQQESNKKKGFKEGLADNSIIAGNNKTDLSLKQPSVHSLHKKEDDKQKEVLEDNASLQDDEDVEKH